LRDNDVIEQDCHELIGSAVVTFEAICNVTFEVRIVASIGPLRQKKPLRRSRAPRCLKEIIPLEGLTAGTEIEAEIPTEQDRTAHGCKQSVN
jgi:hypothetical protein